MTFRSDMMQDLNRAENRDSSCRREQHDHFDALFDAVERVTALN